MALHNSPAQKSKGPGKAEAGRSPQESRVMMTELVLPQHTNALGSIFGGVVMSWADIASAIAAQRHSGRTCVTASIDEFHFLRPIKTGYVVNITAQVTAVHNTSCEVMVEVMGENPQSGEKFQTARSFLTFVALDHDGKPVPMPPLKPLSAAERELQAQAALRRKMRQKLRDQLRGKHGK